MFLFNNAVFVLFSKCMNIGKQYLFLYLIHLDMISKKP